MEGPSAGLIPESFALLPFVCDLLKTRVLFFPILWCIQIGWQVRTAAFNFLSPWSTPRLLYMRTMSYNHAKLYQRTSISSSSATGEALNPPNELCPALVSGLTVQPCGELRCSAAGFKFFFPFWLCLLNKSENKSPSSVPGGMSVVTAKISAGEVPGFKPWGGVSGWSCRNWQQRTSTEHSVLFWRTDEHWKQGCMVSCRTVQGRKRCAKRHAKPALDRAR